MKRRAVVALRLKLERDFYPVSFATTRAIKSQVERLIEDAAWQILFEKNARVQRKIARSAYGPVPHGSPRPGGDPNL